VGEGARSRRGCGGGGDPLLSGAARPAVRGADVWLAPVALARRPEEVARARAIATPDELAECAAFRADEDRSRALVTRAVVRRALSSAVPVAPETWRFARGANGRPAIAAPSATGLAFSVAHTRELVACAVAVGGEIGADVESPRRLSDPMAVAREVTDRAEFAALAGLPEALRAERLCALWTLKEAYLKARGLGLALAPSLVGFDFDAEGRLRLRLDPSAADDADGWTFDLARADDDHLLALARRGTGASEPVRVRRLRGFGVPPDDEPLRPLASTGRGATR
jgi:4'-phosphopantetheinyl transferase